MIRKHPMMALFMAALLTSAVQASEQNDERDEQAVSALKAMSTYLAGLKSFTVSGLALEDEGESTRDLYIHEGSLTLYDSAKGYYATTSVPAGLDAGMDYALEELGIDAPLMDLVYMDPSTRLAGTTDPVLYLTGKSRVDGVDCHQLAIRVEDADVQLWVQEGNTPLPRRIMITAKWEAGSPRFNAHMNWNTQPDIAQGEFEFDPPEDAVQIQFEPLD
jgi:hypothetical protein